MPSLQLDTTFMRSLDPTGKLELWAKGVQSAINNAAKQVNAAPVGKMGTPPTIAALNVSANSSGFHSFQIVDNQPPQGTVYHIESSDTADFENPQPVVSNTPYRNFTVFQGTAALHYRAFSSFIGGPPSEVVYYGGQASPITVQSSSATIAGPEPLPSTGSGSGSSQLPQGGMGFGFGAVGTQNQPADRGA